MPFFLIPNWVRPAGPRATLLLVFVILNGGLATRAVAQEPRAILPSDGPYTGLPIVGPKIADPPVAGFVKGLSETSAVIEIKLGQGRYLSLLRDLAQPNQPAPFIAVGDPSITDFDLTKPNLIRLLGKKIGTTDLTIVDGEGVARNFEVRVTADLEPLRAELQQLFPEASLRIRPLREKIIVEGQARDALQVNQILAVVDTYIRSIQTVLINGQIVGQVADASLLNRVPLIGSGLGVAGEGGVAESAAAAVAAPTGGGYIPPPTAGAMGGGAGVGLGGAGGIPGVSSGSLQVVNLIKVPSAQQVLLKVRVAEMNRTAFRAIGGDFLATIPQFGDVFGSRIGGNSFVNSTTGPLGGFVPGNNATFFGTFSNGQFNTILNALRRNSILKILAEPNLVTLNGHQASFLAGGQFPIPVLQGGAGGLGGNGGISVQFKDFGVQLAFLPVIRDDDIIRLTVDPTVSTIDFSVGTTLVPGGVTTPGLSVRTSHTTVELKAGDTLAIAGLMQLSLDGQTQRIPGLGDLPFIGEFFSNTTSSRIEKELIVLVTPYLIEAMTPGQVPPGPGDEVKEPNDLEFFFLNRIEGRTGVDARNTTRYDDPLHLIRHALVERRYILGPAGYSR